MSEEFTCQTVDTQTICGFVNGVNTTTYQDRSGTFDRSLIETRYDKCEGKTSYCRHFSQNKSCYNDRSILFMLHLFKADLLDLEIIMCAKMCFVGPNWSTNWGTFFPDLSIVIITKQVVTT